MIRRPSPVRKAEDEIRVAVGPGKLLPPLSGAPEAKTQDHLGERTRAKRVIHWPWGSTSPLKTWLTQFGG